MSDVLIVYASTHGHTAKIARRLAEVVREAGQPADVRAAGEEDPSPRGYRGVIAGGSIHGGHYQRELVDWARHHALALGELPSAFFSVCLAVADETDEAREAARGYIATFADATGWAPRTATTFAGALQYLEYDFMTRLMMRLMMRRGGHPTDTTRDFDYTDWEAVARFGREFARSLTA